ncbi:hypothetical protein ABPG72_014004 [Tetrahymena utriculariae]
MEDWDNLHLLEDLLRPFYFATELLSTQNQAMSFEKLIAIYLVLYNHLNHLLQFGGNNIKLIIKKVYSSSQQKIYTLYKSRADINQKAIPFNLQCVKIHDRFQRFETKPGLCFFLDENIFQNAVQDKYLKVILQPDQVLHNTTLTCHYIDTLFIQRSWLLSTFELENHHTSENIANKFLQILEHFELPIEGLKEGVGVEYPIFTKKNENDNINQKNELKQEIKIPHLPCISHILHNTLTSVQESNFPEYQTHIDKIRSISKYLRQSTIKNNKIQLIQKQYIEEQINSLQQSMQNQIQKEKQEEIAEQIAVEFGIYHDQKIL